MDRKQLYKLAVGIAAAGVAVMAMPSVAFAQEAAKAAGEATFLTGQGAAWLGGSAVESMARQPAAAGQISTAMIITAAMIEGATLFAVVVGMLAVLKA